jgi:hypothetical protein
VPRRARFPSSALLRLQGLGWRDGGRAVRGDPARDERDDQEGPPASSLAEALTEISGQWAAPGLPRFAATSCELESGEKLEEPGASLAPPESHVTYYLSNVVGLSPFTRRSGSSR